MGLTMQSFRDLLRVDLKDSGTLWGNPELDRCVQRAVDDLSRHLPLEKVYEVTPDFTVTDETITTPKDADPDYIVDNVTLNGETAGGTLSLVGYAPDVPRRLTVTLTDANKSVTTLTIIVKGYDQDGNYIEESWYLKDLVSGTALQGDLYFKRVTQVEVDNIAGSLSAADVIDVGTGNAYDSFVYLANKPIKPASETVTSSPAGTTYTRDTDYRIDYVNGAIKFINPATGSMAANTSYLVDYTKSRLGVDVSSLLPVVTRIQRVEYPTHQVPQQFVSFNILGDFMYIGSKMTGQSQEEMTTSKDDHLAIYYERRHFPPGEDSPGSYPDVLDEVIAIGAGGYALLIEAIQYEQQAVTDLASMRTELGLTTVVHTSFKAAADKVAKYLENNTNEDSKYWLTKITTDLAGLRTAFLAAVDAAAGYLDDVDTTDLGKADVGAEALLEIGDDLINAVNVGEGVAENYAAYSAGRVNIANARINAAIGYVQEAGLRMENLKTYIQQAEGWGNIALGFISEAQQRLAEVSLYIQEASSYAEVANGDLVLADKFRAEGLSRLSEFKDILKSKAEYRKRVSSTPLKQPS